ncbi:hypothetical protein Salat_1290500 [Sesamum alatum]|uniref:Uncharacterized protein n=1 Tax=Sesamum alatum TaxID=300844 RepID=A0AAE1YHZ9_9LAMI|nr:hypothetical protein Salat_1290500 [Sesamum alatum]
MTVPRPGPVTPARAAPRKLEGRTTELEALPRAPAPARGRCLEPPARPESSSRQCLEHQPRLEAQQLEALPRAHAPARGRCLEPPARPESGSRQCLEHQPRLEAQQLEALPRAAGSAREQLEAVPRAPAPPALPKSSSRHCLEHQLADRPARAGPAHQRPPRAGQRTSSR